ncbi:DUF5691 domain-containing protein [Arthrobacter celericrescens]|uniref:DUF5691 domain-containing protein n=1 Tax=Arthrobacter celericrescens TaxID=2320851 RepID=UPI000EA2D61B|nr:DUF5691 domain-containing protein [Arthrobacter celericrescens]
MSWLAELRTSALVGTARHEAPPPPGDLGVRPPEGLTREESLLDQAALADVATRAARQPGGLDTAVPDAAPPDTTEASSESAARLLDLLLNQPPVGAELRDQLVADWLRSAEASRRRVPHRLLPTLLSLADSKPGIAEHLQPAIGTRGQWLQELRHSHSAAAPRSRPVGPNGPALTGIERLRPSHPTEARGQLDLDWEDLGARERAARLGALAATIHPDDEGLLERALDDPAKSVREVAATLLDRLPASARAGRMAARLRLLLHSRGVLRKQLDVELPPPPDAAALRDGIAPDPRNGEPDRLARLDSIIRGAPLDVWTTASGRGPQATLALLGREARVINTIAATAALRSDLEWIRALLEVRTDLQLLGSLPADERERFLVQHLRAGPAQSLPAQSLQLIPLLRGLPRPWGSALADAALEHAFAKEGGQLAAGLAAFLPMCLPHGAVDRYLRHGRSDDDAVRRRLLRDIVQYQSFRQSLTEAFR